MLRLLRLALAIAALAAVLRAQDDPPSRRAAIESMYPVMIDALEAKAFGRARNICEQAILWEPQNPVHHYNLACIEAQAGRLPQAMGALELSVALGFNDPRHLQNDPDLVPLHGDPKFPEIVRKVTNNAIAANAVAGMAIPETKSRRPGSAAPAGVENAAPVASGWREDRPVGLYWQTAPRGTAPALWYFAPEGTVYQNLQFGFSPADLAAHAGPKGNCQAAGKTLEVKWTGGATARGELQREKSGGFRWNRGTFEPVKAFAAAKDVAALYRAGEPIVSGIPPALAAQPLELRGDGTFTWTGVALSAGPDRIPQAKVDARASAKGTWQLVGWSLRLKTQEGIEFQRIACPVKPDRLYFGGIVYRKR